MIDLQASLLLAVLAVAAQPPPDRDCRDDNAVDRCTAAEQGRMRSVYGVRPIEEHLAAGDQIRRVFYVDGYGRDVVLIAFVRTAGREPAAWVYFPRSEGASAPAPFQAPVPEAAWEDILRRSAFFERELAPTRTANGDVPLCMHSWVYLVEATDPPRGRYDEGRVRRATRDACEDSPAALFAFELQRAALSLFPPCLSLDATQHRNPASQLAACATLSGDRMAAAQVMNLTGAFRRVSSSAEAGLIYGRFANNAVVDWNGERNSGEGSAMAFWIGKIREQGRPSFFLHSIHGETAQRVRLRAFLSRTVGEAGAQRRERAEVEMLWVWQPYAQFAVEHATVGAWQAERD